jgi:hypothetical protein
MDLNTPGTTLLWPHAPAYARRVGKPNKLGKSEPRSGALFNALGDTLGVMRQTSCARLASRARTRYVPRMSTQEILLEEIKRQP